MYPIAPCFVRTPSLFSVKARPNDNRFASYIEHAPVWPPAAAPWPAVVNVQRATPNTFRDCSRCLTPSSLGSLAACCGTPGCASPRRDGTQEEASAGGRGGVAHAYRHRELGKVPAARELDATGFHAPSSCAHLAVRRLRPAACSACWQRLNIRGACHKNLFGLAGVSRRSADRSARRAALS